MLGSALVLMPDFSLSSTITLIARARIAYMRMRILPDLMERFIFMDTMARLARFMMASRMASLRAKLNVLSTKPSRNHLTRVRWFSYA